MTRRRALWMKRCGARKLRRSRYTRRGRRDGITERATWTLWKWADDGSCYRRSPTSEPREVVVLRTEKRELSGTPPLSVHMYVCAPRDRRRWLTLGTRAPAASRMMTRGWRTRDCENYGNFPVSRRANWIRIWKEREESFERGEKVARVTCQRKTTRESNLN